jgi:hypothetical protein
MDNNISPGNNLDKYFSKARNMQPATSLEEVNDLIKNAPAHSTDSRSIPKTRTLKFQIIMSTSIIIIALYVSSLFFPKSGNKTEPKNDGNKISSVANSTSNNVLKEDHQNKNLVKNHNRFITVNPLPSPPELDHPPLNLPPDNLPAQKPGDLENPSNVSDNQHKRINISDHYDNPANTRPGLTMKDIKPLELDIKTLSKIGFSQTKKGLHYECIVKGLTAFKYDLYPNGEERRLNNRVEFFKTRPVDFYPAFITDIDGNDEWNLDSTSHNGRHRDSATYSNFSTQFNLLPVVLKRPPSKDTNAPRDVIFWFTITPTLLEKLNSVDQKTIEASEIKLTGYQLATLSPSNTYISQLMNSGHVDPTALSDIKFLELKPVQMKKLGFKISSKKVQFNCNIKPDTMPIQVSANQKEHIAVIGQGTFEFIHSWKGTSLSIDGQARFNGKGQDFYPVFISDRHGRQQFKYRLGKLEPEDKWTDKYFLSTIRKLVPVLVKNNYASSKNPEKDFIFWFNVTPSFLAALPDTVSKEMSKEYNVLVGNKDESEQAKNDPPSCKYFDVCQLPLERQLKVNIYPNPAQTKLNVDFELGTNTSATISMTDLGGKVVRNIDQTYSGTGSQHSEIMVGDLKPGIYLVLLKLSNGVVLTNKVMIRGQE